MRSPHEQLLAELQATFPEPANRAVVNWLSHCTSAHGDLVQRLAEVVRYCPVTMWSPEGDFPFVVVLTESGVVVGAAVSMNEIYIRIPRHLEEAIDEGVRVVDPGPGWYCFEAFCSEDKGNEQTYTLRRWFEAAIKDA